MGGNCSTITVVSGDGCASLAARCGITAAQFTQFNPSPTLCSTLAVGQKVCCSAGGLPVPVENPDGTCASYTVAMGDTCNAIALSNSITEADLETWNNATWGWQGCADLQIINICLSTGSPPMPAPVSNAICGPTVPGTANPGPSGNLSLLNPCPLNACCDAFGQCGTTSDFCTITQSPTGAPGTTGCISNCGTDIISAPQPPFQFMSIAYFEAFNVNRTCLNMDVRQIDTTKYTHIHFAFLDITTSFEVDTSQYMDALTNFASMTGVKRIASFGGWTMSTDPATYNIFRSAVSTDANRQAFASNLVAFVNKFGLDGIDIDWEYPGEQDIPGIPADSTDDGENLLTFLNVLTLALPVGKTLSVTVPAGYWYLRAFPIAKIVNSVNYMVYMTYDLHGQWDYDSAFDDLGCPEGGCLRSHVNLTDTLNALSMITKAGVNSNQLVIGVSSYGRAFQMSAAGCTGPQCTFTGPASGATPGRCTNTAGYIANAEIDEIIAGGATVTHDTSSDSDIVVYDSTQWIGYMNNKTKASRTTMYKGLNMGGTSDWAVDLQAFLPAFTPTPPKPTRNPCTQAQGWVDGWVNTLLNNGKFEGNPVIVEGNPAIGCGCWNDVPQMWQNPVVVQALVDYTWAKGGSPSNLVPTFIGDTFFIATGTGESPPDISVEEYGGSDWGYDDILWASNGWLKYWEWQNSLGITGKNQNFVLNSAKTFIDMAASTINETCPGGISWKPDANSGKNTITAALFIHASATYSMIKNDASYLALAETVWNWVTASDGPKDSTTGLYQDGPSNPACKFGTGDFYSYNQGEMLAAAAALFMATGKQTYLTTGNDTLYALVFGSTKLEMDGILFEQSCDANACTETSEESDRWAFKGITMRGVQYFLDAANNPDLTAIYSAWIGFQAAAITKNAVSSDGIGNVWYKSSPQKINSIGEISAISAGNAAVKYGANDGTFTC